MIVVITSTTFRSSSERETIMPALLAAEARAQGEPGTVAYRIALDPRNRLRTHGLEIYESEETLRSHLNAPYIRDLTDASHNAGAALSLTAYQGALDPVDLRHLLLDNVSGARPGTAPGS